ncbi:MurR/RpiR family transcriptional regulator [Paenibacillus hodogayensis]|uniref:MurR/RpiR family transcriptional regulator n=1 Tax=Paenibacillus hodogayensis TaxID=279208 RepID=A0ABV5VUN2_9BACL
MELTFESKELSRGHRRIADYISKHMEELPFMVEEDLAAACQVSTSTVSRFWAEVGCKNLKEFKQKVKDEIFLSPSQKLQSAFSKMNEEDAAASLLIGVDYLQQTAERLSQESFERAASMLREAGTVYIYGPGSSASLAALIDFRLTRFGIRVSHLSRGGHELFDRLVHVQPQDVMLIFGFVTESPELAVLLDHAGSKGCKTLLITDLVISEMVEKATVTLYTARGQLWEFHSMVAPIALLETLIVKVGKQMEEHAVAVSEELHELRRKYQKLLPKRV